MNAKRGSRKSAIRINLRTLGTAVVIAAMFIAPIEIGSETITLSTTYPSPVGIYERLITTGSQGSPTLLARDGAGANVGIGTPTPQAKLDVAGVVRIGRYSATTNPPTPVQGGIYYNIDGSGQFLGSDGASWTPLGGGRTIVYSCPYMWYSPGCVECTNSCVGQLTISSTCETKTGYGATYQIIPCTPVGKL